MSNGHQMDYGFGNKAQWRRTVWNRIVDRLEVPARDAVVLYLAGEKDLDREVAIRKGFRDENLIAIERDAGVCKKLRSCGTLTINGDIDEVIKNWSSPQIDVVFADFCCGFLKHIQELAVALAANDMMARSVLMFNLLRGRENQEQAGLRIVKHRAHNAFLANQAGCQTRLAQTGFNNIAGTTIEQWNRFGDALRRLDNGYTPSAGSYKSKSNQIFDWGVWKNYHCLAVIHKTYTHLMGMKAELIGCENGAESKQRFDDYATDCIRKTSTTVYRDESRKTQNEMTRQIAAVKAARTRKIEQRVASYN